MWNGDPVFYSRLLTELTLSFHIIYATLGVGVPLMIAIAQWVGIRKNDMHYILLARRWTRGFVITVAVGVVTGTAIGLQLSLLWPKFMEVAGQVIGLPLFMETFAFFFEAIFLGIYLYTWDRFKDQKKHFFLLIPVAIGSSASAFFITVVNAFMNTPQGYTMENGVITNIDPIMAMFNPAMPTKVGHVLTTAYMTSSLVLAAIAAFHLLRGNKHVYHKKALHLTMKAAFIFSIANVLVGDLSGKFLAEYQPEKLAAAEWHFETESHAPLILFGTLNEEMEVKGAIEIPYALSILAHNIPNSEVIGLNEFPEEERPPLYIHYLFDLMVVIGIFLTIISGLYWVLVQKGWKMVDKKWMLNAIIISGPLAMVAIEIGWFFAEIGRQPWILRGFLKTSEAATNSTQVEVLVVIFSVLYVLLAVVSVVVLIKMFKRNPVEQELTDRSVEKKVIYS